MSLRTVSARLAIVAVISASPAVAETLPDFLVEELAPLIAVSTAEEIDPGVYELSRANQTYSDEIACILVKYFGQSEQIERDMLAVVDDEVQRTAVVESINTCLRSAENDEGDGAGQAFAGEEDGATVTTTSENPSQDVNSTVTPN